MSAHGGWLVAGAGLMVAGLGLARFWWFEFGMALVLLGAAALGYLVGLVRSAVLDAELTERIDRQLDELREQQRRALEEKWLSDGVSPIEQSWRALTQRAADEDPTAATVPANDIDRRLDELIGKRCEQVWRGIKEKRYWRQVDGKTVAPDFGVIGKEIEDVVREVAGLYHKDRDDPVMEARLGDIVLTGRSVLGELLQIARLVPLVDLPAQSLATVKTRMEQVQQVRKAYRFYARYRRVIDVGSIATRATLGWNPLILAAWFVGGEALRLAGAHVVTKYVNAWLRDALESSVALVYEHVARIYEPGRVQRSADYVALVQALDVHRRIPGVDHNRKLLLDHILRVRIPDEFAKLALLRALADDGVPSVAEAPLVDLRSLPPAKRQAITDRLVEILPEMRGLDEPEVSQAIEDLENSLGHGLQVSLVLSGSRAAVRVQEGFESLAKLACDWCRFDRERARKEIWDGPFAGAARKVLRKNADGEEPVRKLLKNALEVAFGEPIDTGGPAGTAVRRLIEPPRDLVGEDLAAPLVDSVIDLLARATPGRWPLEHDHMVLLNASVLLGAPKQVEARWDRYLAAVSTRLRARLKYSQASSWPAAAAPAILRASGDQELPRQGIVVTPPSAPRPLAVFEAAGEEPPCWVLLFADRAVVGRAPEGLVALDDAEPEVHAREGVRFLRRKGILSDDLVVCCGDRRLAVAGPVAGTFAGFFGPVLKQYGFDVDALEVDEEA
ncbi:MAG: hypothetical protein F4137_13440 [Acidobacteria bacterium]|nr:hypothetical protein [Acidobacteriota bacterium]